MTIENLLDALKSSSAVRFKSTSPVDADELIDAITPPFGEISWAPPPSYRAALAKEGAVAAHRLHPATESWVGFKLLGADEIGETNESLVHMPEGVSRDEGVYLSTNHLVGFAEAGYEAVFCFDVSAPGPEYPVYYHHQDEPRAKILATGAWETEDDSQPDFPSFTAWLTAMTEALTAEEMPAWVERLGQPHLRFG